MIESYDILGLGCTTVDDLLYVPHYPPADGKIRVRERQRQCGGLTGTALVAASRLGARCVFAGTLGDNQLSDFVRDHLLNEGIEISHAYLKATAQPIQSVIVIDESTQTRTILYDTTNSFGAQDTWPDEDVIRSARVLFVDPYGTAGMIRAARICRDRKIPVVADFESDEFPHFHELLELVDHLILSASFAGALTGKSTLSEMATELWEDSRQAVVVTDGVNGGCYVTASTLDEPCHYDAFRVDSVDTTGCGDVFHGAYAAALGRGVDLDDRIRFSAAAAAIKTTRYGGQAGIPSRDEVERFLEAIE